ncbi:MAG: class I SAM-dependent DNA methyltransferase [Dehalococcoidia bacterium]|nr:class I SAM-dependent DNA methyltransferase [Dehalococcoidia bacterium]
MAQLNPTMTPAAFVAKWSQNARRERAGSQSHFNDLCALVGVATPNEADPEQTWYCFERGASKTTGGDGWADVWMRHHFGWEYKGAHKDLDAAYRQLHDYREALEHPPFLVVSDMDRIIIRTAFNNTKTQTYQFSLADLRDAPDEPLKWLRAVFTDPDSLKPTETPDEVTRGAATRFAQIARSLQERGHPAEDVAHFLNRVLFCLFAEDVNLLPNRIVTGLIESRRDPAAFNHALGDLFDRMSHREAIRFWGNDPLLWFNGGLFDGAPVIEFTREELRLVQDAARLDWSQVEPSILGTLFERGLDPAKRGQLGAHYTDTGKIMQVVEPVVMTPLRREFAAMQERVDELMAGRTPSPFTRRRLGARRRLRLPAWERQAEATWYAFLDRLEGVRVLDPACGSGNFLYVTLKLLKDLEHQAIGWGSQRLGIPGRQPRVGPQNVLGLEVNPYARELAGVSIWIGFIQWTDAHGYGREKDPVLRPLDNIELRDAILARDAEGNPIPAAWPEAEFIVGNPPFLGGNYIRQSLGDEYVDDLFAAYTDRVPRFADLVCYWHEAARAAIAASRTRRVGLLATNSIRGGANREVLQRVKDSGDIFVAWSDEPWVVDGAAVRVSIVCQDDGTEPEKCLDGRSVLAINADLTAGIDLTLAERLQENAAACFMGPSAKAPFDIDGALAREMITSGGNVNGRSNLDVVRPVASAIDIARRSRDMWTIYFGLMSEREAAPYERPFEYVKSVVLPARANRRDDYRGQWWQYARPRPEMNAAMAGLERFIVTPAVAKHRLFVWMTPEVICNQGTLAIARDDDYAFGVLHSSAHERWSLRMGTWLGKGNDPRYTPTTTFETFPFPWPLDTSDDALTEAQRGHRDAIGAAARALDEKRRHWLNPPDLVRAEPDVLPSLPPRLLPVDEAAAKELKTRTLTNLYNARPTWLEDLHRDLDRAVFAAYGWPEATDPEGPDGLDEETMLGRLLALNLARAAAE